MSEIKHVKDLKPLDKNPRKHTPRNDWWCKGLGLTQPKSQAYERYMNMKRERHV